MRKRRQRRLLLLCFTVILLEVFVGKLVDVFENLLEPLLFTSTQREGNYRRVLEYVALRLARVHGLLNETASRARAPTPHNRAYDPLQDVPEVLAIAKGESMLVLEQMLDIVAVHALQIVVANVLLYSRRSSKQNADHRRANGLLAMIAIMALEMPCWCSWVTDG